VPAWLRSTAVGAAVAASPRARAAVVWLEPGTLPEPGPVLLVPAAAATPPEALAALLAAGAGAVLAASQQSDAPVVAADTALAASLAFGLAAASPLGDDIRHALKSHEPTAVEAGWYVRVRDAGDAAAVETRLLANLGSAIDTRLDVALHRRLSRPVTRAAVALGIPPNAITAASLALGLLAAWGFWRADVASAVAALAVYIVSVALDHADGEVARLTLTESRVGEWLDVGADNLVHAAIVLAMGVTTQATTGTGLWIGVLGTLGTLGSAVVAKLWPPRGGEGVGSRLENMGSRDGFYAMLVLFIGALALAPALLPWLMALVAVGSNAYWIARIMVALTRRS
jgi:phosphatidylglycerophosphate synthase